MNGPLPQPQDGGRGLTPVALFMCEERAVSGQGPCLTDSL